MYSESKSAISFHLLQWAALLLYQKSYPAGLLVTRYLTFIVKFSREGMEMLWTWDLNSMPVKLVILSILINSNIRSLYETRMTRQINICLLSLALICLRSPPVPNLPVTLSTFLSDLVTASVSILSYPTGYLGIRSGVIDYSGQWICYLVRLLATLLTQHSQYQWYS